MIATFLVLTLRAITLLEVPHLSRIALPKRWLWLLRSFSCPYVLTAFGDTAGVPASLWERLVRMSVDRQGLLLLRAL